MARRRQLNIRQRASKEEYTKQTLRSILEQFGVQEAPKQAAPEQVKQVITNYDLHYVVAIAKAKLAGASRFSQCTTCRTPLYVMLKDNEAAASICQPAFDNHHVWPPHGTTRLPKVQKKEFIVRKAKPKQGLPAYKIVLTLKSRQLTYERTADDFANERLDGLARLLTDSFSHG